MEIFEKQLTIALACNLPIIIHIRDAHDEVIKILKRKGKKDYKGVIHYFSGTYDIAMELIDMGFHISIPGPVTYKNVPYVSEVASKIPIETLLLETDAPFSAPVPKRGKRNEPAFVKYTAEYVAKLRGIDLEELGEQTTQNAIKLFNLPKKP